MDPSSNEMSGVRHSTRDIELTNMGASSTKIDVHTSQTDLASQLTPSVQEANDDASEHETTLIERLAELTKSLFHKHELDPALERPHMAGKRDLCNLILPTKAYPFEQRLRFLERSEWGFLSPRGN